MLASFIALSTFCSFHTLGLSSLDAGTGDLLPFWAPRILAGPEACTVTGARRRYEGFVTLKFGSSSPGGPSVFFLYYCHVVFTFFSVHCVCSLFIVYIFFMTFPSPEPFWGLLSTFGVLFRHREMCLSFRGLSGGGSG